MVLDGHDGVRACEFAQKHLPSVFLQSDIRDEYSLRTALQRAFYLTEMEFFVRIDPHITRRMTLQLEIDVRKHMQYTRYHINHLVFKSFFLVRFYSIL